MPAIRVLVVDDSIVVRKILGEVLTGSAVEVVGSVGDGSSALGKIPVLKPDLVTLDVEMPGMSGLETLAQIRKQHPTLPVIMFSTLTASGAATTLDALALGASDYVTKPSNAGNLDQTRRLIQSELIPKIQALCQGTKPSRATAVLRANAPDSQETLRTRPTDTARIDIVAIGTSTGGPNALAAVLPALAKDFPAPIVVVQHMPPLFTKLLADRLDKRSGVTVREGVAGEVLKPGDAWIAPGDFHMTVARDGNVVRLALNQAPPENSCRPAVDPLFRSVAKTFGEHSLAVVLTGMGSDGFRGAQMVKDAGGQLVVQDEATSVVWGMPGQIAAAGFAERVLPLGEIGAEIERRARACRWNSRTTKEAVKQSKTAHRTEEQRLGARHPENIVGGAKETKNAE